jgi:hypothetical protein
MRAVRGVPTFASTASSSSSVIDETSLHPIRRILLRNLDTCPNEYWCVLAAESCAVVGYVATELTDDTTVKIRRVMRKVAYGALRDGDSTCINILAAIVVEQPRRIAPLPAVEHHSFLGSVSFDDDDIEVIADVWADLREQFQFLFDLDEEGLRDARKEGLKEIEKPQWAVLKALNKQIRKSRCVLFPFFSSALPL